MLLWHVLMSLDGFISGPGDDMDWVFDFFGPNESVDEVVASTGALVVGKRTYEVEDRNGPGFYGGAFTGPFFVLTHQVPADVPGSLQRWRWDLACPLRARCRGWLGPLDGSRSNQGQLRSKREGRSDGQGRSNTVRVR
jgi:hypothetical protein